VPKNERRAAPSLLPQAAFGAPNTPAVGVLGSKKYRAKRLPRSHLFQPDLDCPRSDKDGQQRPLGHGPCQGTASSRAVKNRRAAPSFLPEAAFGVPNTPAVGVLGAKKYRAKRLPRSHLFQPDLDCPRSDKDGRSPGLQAGESAALSGGFVRVSLVPFRRAICRTKSTTAFIRTGSPSFSQPHPANHKQKERHER